MTVNSAQDSKASAETKGDFFSRFAFWQFLVFILLLLFIWTCQLLDLSSGLSGLLSIPEKHLEAYLISIGVVIVGIITVGNSYIQQQHTLQRLLRTCSVCRRVQIDPSVWEHVEEYMERHQIAGASREICTTCMSKDILSRGHLQS